ncbi:MAG: hypothetical protein V2B19_12815 [Pseudomonadota bacterium]
MNDMLCSDFDFPPTAPATTLKEVWEVFDPMLAVDPSTNFYIPRTDPKLQNLSFKLKQMEAPLHAFLCGHRGSGKSTELKRLCLDPEIQDKYFTLFLTAQHFGSEVVHLTHDALLVEIGVSLAEKGTKVGMPESLAEELNDWGKQVVTSFVKDEALKAEVGAKGSAWLAYFKAQLGMRREWKREEKLKLEPRIQDLIGILNRMAQELKNRTKKKLLVVIDDLEKGESAAHKEMHTRLFQENYDTLVQPRFSIVYTVPIYFRGLPGSRIPTDEIYAFSAIRLYDRENKVLDLPPLCKDHAGFQLIRRFVEKRLHDLPAIFSEEVLDELLRIGGGLFRETARAIHEASYFAQLRGAARIEMEDAREVYNLVKKEYQPIIRGEAVSILKNVQASAQGWVDGVEPYLQSRAVVEYENGDLWLDLRHVLKPYVKGLSSP